MAYTMNIRGRKIYLAQMASSPCGDYIVYEWNDGVFIPNEEDLSYDDDEDILEDDDDLLDAIDEGENEDDEDIDIILDDDEDEVEAAVREDIEAILSDGFIPQGGVSTLITPEYTTCYTQAFFRKK